MSLAVRRMFVMASAALLVAAVDGLPTTPVEKYHRCGEEDKPTSDFQSLADKIAKELAANTPEQNYNWYDEITKDHLSIYGHGICKNGITVEECIRCLQATDTLRLIECHFVMDWIISTDECYLRISDTDFRWGPADKLFF